MKYKKYPTYKDSGVRWLGEIPTEWDLFSLKRTVDKCINGIWGEEPDGINDLIVLRVADFNRTDFTISDDKLTYRAIEIKDRKTRQLKKGDLLIEKSGGGENQLVGTVVSFDKEYSAVTSNFVAKMTPLKKYNYRYINYAFSHLYSSRVNYMSIKQTTGIQNLDSDQYLSEYFSIPSLKEQQQIASFLDTATDKIDTLIEKQERLIELLKEKRQAVISHAVTKGLDPDVKMKDSRVEWLGNVPEHWEIWKFKHFAPIITCGLASTPIYVDEGIPFLSAQNIRNGKLSLHKYNFISNELHKRLTKNRKPEKGDLLVTRVGAGIGQACVVDIDMEFSIYVSLSQIRLNQNVASPQYIKYFLDSKYCEMLNTIGTEQGGGVGNLNVQNVEKYKIPLPDLIEQKLVSKKLDIQTTKINTLIKKATKSITLLKEKRTALISAAVTGKIDVREIA